MTARLLSANLMSAVLPSTRRGRWTTALVLTLAVALGLGSGTALALWRDSEPATGVMPVGVAVFGVGAPGELQFAEAEDPLTFQFGVAEAQVLHESGAIAIPIQVDSLSQGHRGLTYDVTPSVEGGLFAASSWTLTKVESAAACTPATPGAAQTSSTPWSEEYSEATTPVSEFWCLVASWHSITGTHENVVEVTGTPDVPGALPPAKASDRWSATVTDDIDPAAEPTHTVTFDFRTFRPGDGP